MSIIKDVGIPAILGLLVIGVIYLAKGFLSFIMGVPLWLMLMAGVAAAVLVFIPFNMVMGYMRYGPEGFIFMEGRKQGIPVICDVEIGTGKAEFILGEKKGPKDPLFKDETSGLKVDPSMVSAFSEPLRFAGGLDVVGFSYHDFLPQTHRNHLAFKAINEYFDPEIQNELWMSLSKEEKQELTCFTTKEKVELISKPEHFLDEDVETKLGKYFKKATDEKGKTLLDPHGHQVYYRQFQTKDGKWMEQSSITIPGMVLLIRKARADITKLPIATGYFCMNEAFKYNNVPYSAQYLAQLKGLLKELADAEWAKLINWLQIGITYAMVIGATILGIYVLHAVVFK